MRRALIAALVAGFAACVVVTVAQQAVVAPLILKAEEFEEANKARPPAGQAQAAPQTVPQAGHQHDADEGWKPEDGIERVAYTALANLGFGVGFALLLVAGFTLAGREVGMLSGLAWGAGGFAAFALAPALGLPPELPGSVSAALLPRQLWWLGTAVATAAGLGLIAFGRHWVLKAMGVLALALPHAVGAPHPPGGHGSGTVPADIAEGFVVLSLVTTALFWIVLGAVSGAVYRRAR